MTFGTLLQLRFFHLTSAPSQNRATIYVRCALTSPAIVLEWMSSGGQQHSHSQPAKSTVRNTTILWGGFLSHYGQIFGGFFCWKYWWIDWLIASLIDWFEFTPVRLLEHDGKGRRRRAVRGHVTGRQAIKCGYQDSQGEKFTFPFNSR